MIDYSDFFGYLQTTALAEIAKVFAARTDAVLGQLRHGDFNKWQVAVDTMPEASPIQMDLGAATVTVGGPGDLNSVEQKVLRENLMWLHPWRKGPFELFGIQIDTEWRSDLKWARMGIICSVCWGPEQRPPSVSIRICSMSCSFMPSINMHRQIKPPCCHWG
jgi:tRNA (mo5U34)-methyltransferase